MEASNDRELFANRSLPAIEIFFLHHLSSQTITTFTPLPQLHFFFEMSARAPETPVVAIAGAGVSIVAFLFDLFSDYSDYYYQVVLEST